MFKRSRIRITAAITGGILIFLCVILAAVYTQSFFDNERKNSEKLDRYVREYSLQSDAGTPGGPQGAGHQGEGKGEPREKDAGYLASAFYSVAFSSDGSVLRTDNSKSAIMSDDELVSLAQKILASEEEQGKSGSLMYRIVQKDGYTLVAFLNIANSRTVMSSLLRVILITAAAALIVLPAAAYTVSGAIIRPLEENDRMQRQFVSDAGHELKTPIAVISTNVELLSRQAGESEWLDNIRYENDRMGTLVRELLELSRAESTGPVMERLDLSRLVEGEVLPFESMAFEKGHELVSSVEEGIFVKGDRIKLCQVVSVLLDNAVEHSLPGGKIELSLKKDRHSAVLKVSNPSEEISDDVLEHMFERFYRADEARSGEGGHYGLGLAIAKAAAQAHKGSIDAAYGDGTVTFTFSLPLK